MCIFGHKFGPVDPTTLIQQCLKCGKAKMVSRPHPCANGHQWKTDESFEYINTRRSPNPFTGIVSKTEWKSFEHFQTCITCGLKRKIDV